MVLDRAGWHTPRGAGPEQRHARLAATLFTAANPVERLWLFLRERHLSHRLLDNYDAIVERSAAPGIRSPERIRSLTSYPYLEQVKV